jgi:uncharacterized protein DUF4184
VPFTGSHPAAVLPFFRPLVPPALVIGSMTPDLGYYVPLPVSSRSMHTAAGVVGIDLILGALCFVAWQVLVAPVVVAAAPAGVRRRLPAGPAPRPVVLVVVSLWVGAATHVLWDEFTHSGRFGTHHLPWLAAQHGPLPGYAWAQYASGVLGGLVLAAATCHWWRTTPPAESAVPALARPSSVGVPVLLATAGGAVWAGAYGVVEEQRVRHTLFLVATWGGGAGLAALLLVCLVLRARPGGSIAVQPAERSRPGH